MLDEDKNEYYSSSNAFIAVIKADDKSLYFVYVCDIAINKRIDPSRIQASILELAKGAHQIVYKAATTTN